MEFIRLWRINYARGRLQKTGGKARRGFSTSSAGPGPPGPAIAPIRWGKGWAMKKVSVCQNSLAEFAASAANKI